ncbi:YeiH family protein [Silvibacterium dinghuense]|uniref:Putative sulfate exporter family transporter n=1 Tax=Silvibacterium dinghuense TaxID=1560006 RepID=A0A4Q1SJZ8_9BACT|nr:putative sulfate exporter family transporter [Silvibacterium dinghuense]RXS98004.1 putative sulfate exporter family transporter [Silvibacterium dinghuense]GGH03744.1 UPF0324 membrane protein [Silvibacterium dinghuense]
MAKNFFFLGIILAAAGFLSPPLALGAGLAYGLLIPHAYHLDARRLSKFLLQASVVLLGFGMNLGTVIRVGRSGFVYTAAGISLALALGWLLGRLLHVEKTQSFLISAGTAVCGGSAIAALGPVTAATDGQMAVSMGTVYILNSAALFLFPAIGSALHLSQTQFGLWSALAIHDTSSVVGAAAKYGATALEVGTTVKLARALWIVPLTVGIAFAGKRAGQQRGKIHLPWFILYFVAAAVANSYLPLQHVPWAAGLYPSLARLGRLGLAVTLFLVGTGITRQTIREVGARPMLQGVLLWVAAAGISLWAILRGIIHL